MRVLITGVAGHLGSALAQWIVENQPTCRIIGCDDLSGGWIESVPHQVELHQCLVGDLHKNDVFKEPFDAVFHFAAYAAECLSPFVRKLNYRSNILPTCSLINGMLSAGGTRLRPHGRLVYASSIAVYGNGAAPFNEEDDMIPNDPYGVAKMACEHDIRIAGLQHGLEYCIVRPHNIYGPGQNIWDKYRNVFGNWMRSILNEEPVIVFGDGSQQRAFSYIDDILPSLWEAGFAEKAYGQTINLGGSEPTRLIDALHILSSVVKPNNAIVVQYERERHEVPIAYCSTDKSKSLLGYEDNTSLEDGLEAMWEWAKVSWNQYPDRRELRKIPIELQYKMPEIWK